MQEVVSGENDSQHREIGPEELAAAQLEIYRQEVEGTPSTSPDHHAAHHHQHQHHHHQHRGETLTPAGLDAYGDAQYGSPVSAYGPEDYEHHDDDSFQRYIITHGLGVDEIEWSSVSDMTDLEEMEMNEREIVSTAPDMEKYNRARRARKPRPPRRFKTIITRIRPKLEAAITDVSPAEEDAALERERKRRKKGQAWLNSMKALAQARREAKARQEAGLPPPEFTLPPTSLTPSGSKKRSKKEESEGLKDENGAGPSGTSGLEMDDSKKGDGRASEAQLQAYDYQGSAENQQYLDALGQEGYDALMAANQAATGLGSNAEAENPTGVVLPSLPVEAPANQDYAALMKYAQEAAAAVEAGTSTEDQGIQDGENNGHAPDESFYQQGFENPDANPVSTLVQAASMFSNGQADAYMQNTNFDYSQLQNQYALPNFAAQFQQPSEGGSTTSGQLPPVPPLGRSMAESPYNTSVSPNGGSGGGGVAPPLSLTVTRTGEKRRRGPPVKKIAGAMLQPLTDEQWEAERKKRKKGYAWVQETKAAAEAERLARAQRAAGLPVAPQARKSRPSSGSKSLLEQHNMFGQHLEESQDQHQHHHQDLFDPGLDGDLSHHQHHHETLADAVDQQAEEEEPHAPQDDIVPFPSTDDDFPLPGELYEGQEQDMAHYMSGHG